MSGRLRRIALMLVVLVVAVGCGDGGTGTEPLADPFDGVERALPDPDAPRRAAPRWEEVLVLTGDGPITEEFPIAEEALQWRVRYRCDAGNLRVTIDEVEEPLVDTTCPEENEAFSIDTGFIDLAVEAAGPWEVTVEQQVDTVHEEPPLDGMDDAEVLATGDFYGVERSGEGTATLFRMPDGQLALRFTEFQTVASPDLYVWVSGADAPATSEEIFRAPYTSLGLITSTLGDQNYLLPAEIEPDDVQAIVVWCAPLQIAYAAAALER